MNRRVTLIVINYNGRSFIEACLDSLRAQSRRADEIVVVDNASPDGSADLVLSGYPEVKLLALPENLGFPAACNAGIDAASGELVGILNNDLVLDTHWLEAMLQADTTEWDFWASRIVFAEAPERVDSAGDGMAVIGAGYKIGHGEAAERHLQGREVFGPCAAAALYRRSMLQALGGFDEDFFLIYEDADLNMRARLRGHRCRYVPEAVANHKGNASIGTFSDNYVFYGHRNSEYVYWKNMPILLLLAYLPERLIFDLLSFAYFSSKGRGRSFVRAKIDFLRNLPAVLGKRREVQLSRKPSVVEFRRLLDRNWLKYRRKAVPRP